MYFFNHDGKEERCDVITCAAPNKSAAKKYQNVSDEENSKVLKDRIRFVLDIAVDNEVNTLILGAYGCGVFGQDATHECLNIPNGTNVLLLQYGWKKDGLSIIERGTVYTKKDGYRCIDAYDGDIEFTEADVWNIE